MKKVGVICGGSGSSKFARVFADYATNNPEFDLGYIANVGDNYWYHGLYVCPDVDIITYVLAGRLDKSKGWGIDSDTFGQCGMLSQLTSSKEWFGLGDSDSALCTRRTELLHKGWSLSAVTNFLCKMLGVKHAVIPSSDYPITTIIKTTAGEMHLQEFWVKHRARPEVHGVEYERIEKATTPKIAVDYLSDSAIICPANPITSILPIVRINQIQNRLSKCRVVVGISPFVGGRPFSGPAGKLMSALGLESNSFGVVRLYSKFLKLMIVDNAEEVETLRKIKDLGVECIKTNIKLTSESKGDSISGEVMGLL